MQNRSFTISFVVAAFAVMMVYSYVSSTEEANRLKYGVETPVVVAKRDIKELEVLDETNLTITQVPREFKQPGTAAKLEDVTGGLAIGPIYKNEQITRSKVTHLGARTGLARQVAIGKRAVTIRVNDETGVAKLVKPGDRVDVLANIDMAAGNKALVEVRTILQDVLVLATGKYVVNTVPGILEVDPVKQTQKSRVSLTEYTTYPNVTLEVDPFQAQSLIFASVNFNGVYLVLRNNDDNMKEDLQKTMAADLLKQSQSQTLQNSSQGGQGAMGGAIRSAIPGKR